MLDTRTRNQAAAPHQVKERAPAGHGAPAVEAPEPKTSIRRETGMPGTAGAVGIRGIADMAGTGSAFRRKGRAVRILSPSDAGIGSRPSAKPVRKARRKVGYAARAAIALFVVACMGGAGYFAIPEATAIRRVSVHGMNSMGETEVVALMGLEPGSTLVNVDTAAIESRIAADPRVARVGVTRSLPDGLVVRLTERKAIASLLVEVGGITRSVLVDAEGVAFMEAAGNGTSADLPVLSGISFENFRIGQRLPGYLSPVLADLQSLTASRPELLSAISEIRVVKLAEHEAELLLYPMHRAIPVRMPPALDEANLASALLVIDILAARESASRIEEIDFRTGTVVYRSKEGRSG